MAFRIRNWKRLYEPAPKEKGGSVHRLKFVKLRAHGHTITQDYNRLCKLAAPGLGEKGWLLPATFGLWAKLLELAADEPRARRDGTVLTDECAPACARDIADMLQWDVEVVAESLALLTHPKVRWIQELRQKPRKSRQKPEKAGLSPEKPALTKTKTKTKTKTETETKTKTKTLTKTKTEQGPDSASSLGGASDSALGQGPAKGNGQATPMDLRGLRGQFVGVAGGRLAEKREGRESQTTSDVTTFQLIAQHVIVGPTYGEAEEQRAALHKLVDKVAKVRHVTKTRAALFVAACKKEYGDWRAADG